MPGPDGCGVGGINFASSDTVSDPRVIYDPASQRWFASQVKYDGEAADPTRESDYYLLGVSDTDDPERLVACVFLPRGPGGDPICGFPDNGRGCQSRLPVGRYVFHGHTNSLGTSLTMIPKADLLANPPTITNRVFFGVTNYADARRRAATRHLSGRQQQRKYSGRRLAR